MNVEPGETVLEDLVREARRQAHQRIEGLFLSVLSAQHSHKGLVPPTAPSFSPRARGGGGGKREER
ncbi:MAG: hypothetical protein HYT87_15050 [Nitrospirae bacterium]|nr:hypothetical protein [Nitrospirota bacterium]